MVNFGEALGRFLHTRNVTVGKELMPVATTDRTGEQHMVSDKAKTIKERTISSWLGGFLRRDKYQTTYSMRWGDNSDYEPISSEKRTITTVGGRRFRSKTKRVGFSSNRPAR